MKGIANASAAGSKRTKHIKSIDSRSCSRIVLIQDYATVLRIIPHYAMALMMIAKCLEVYRAIPSTLQKYIRDINKRDRDAYKSLTDEERLKTKTNESSIFKYEAFLEHFPTIVSAFTTCDFFCPLLTQMACTFELFHQGCMDSETFNKVFGKFYNMSHDIARHNGVNALSRHYFLVDSLSYDDKSFSVYEARRKEIEKPRS